MKKYLMDKHQWSEKTWQTIDRDFIKMTMKAPVSTSAKSQWFKFMHDLQPLGSRKKKMLHNITDHFSDLCPCCTKVTEDQLHLLLCVENPKRTEALVELHTGGSKYSEHHYFVQTMTECVEQWLQDPTQSPSGSSTASQHRIINDRSLPGHTICTLHEALKEQDTIGWINMFRGFISLKWQQLASTNMVNAQAPLQPDDGRRRLGTILQRIQGFLKTIWIGRNEKLHGRQQDDISLFQTLEAAEIRHYHNQPHLLDVQDQHYCTVSLIKLLRSRPANRRRWLMRVRKARAHLLKEQVRQVKITAYFPRKNQLPLQVNHSVSNHNTNQTSEPDHRKQTDRQKPGDSSNDIQQSHTAHQQAKLTHFFPGRPPDRYPNNKLTQVTKSPASTE